MGVQYGGHTIRQGAKPDTEAKVLKAKLSLNWTGPYMSSQLAPALQRTPRTDLLSRQSSCIWIFLPICPALMLADACH